MDWNLKKILAKKRRELLDKLELAGAEIESEAVLNISGHNGDELKAVDTGHLMGSITHKVYKKDLKVRIGTNVEYAPYVELGTYKMPERPFLTTAFIESRPVIKEIFGIK